MFNKLRKSLSRPINKYMIKDINDWTTDDVCEWLIVNGLEDIVEYITKHAINGMVLKNLTDKELIEIGVTKIGHRKKILTIVKDYTGEPNIETRELDLISESTLTSSYDNSTIQIKFDYEGIIRRFKLPKGSTLSELKAELKTKFDISSRATIEFMDRDKDKISINSEEDWSDYLKESNYAVKLFITKPTSRSSSRKDLQNSSSSRSELKNSTSSKKSRRRYSYGIFDKFIQAIIITDEKGIIQYINPISEKLLNYKKKELIGKNVKVIMPTEYSEHHDEYITNYLTTGNPHVIGKGRNVTAMTKTGIYIPVHLQLTENYSSGRRLFVGMMTEAHEEEKTQSALHMIREVLCNLVNPSIVITDKGIIQVFNKAAQKFWGYTMEEVIGKNIKMLMPPEYAQDHDKYIQNYLTTGQAKIIGIGRNVLALLKDGSVKNIHLAVTEKKDGDQIIFTGIITIL